MSRQLRMVRPNLEDLPDLVIPEGYGLRSYIKGDEIHWANIITDSFGGSKRTAEDTRKEIIERDVFVPDGLFFTTYEDTPVGTACAWKQSIDETEVGYVPTWSVLRVNTLGTNSGNGLSLAVLYYFRDNGFICSMLDTDDFRIPAIKTYLNLGFIPLYVEDTQHSRWKQIFETLDLPFMEQEINHLRRFTYPGIVEKKRLGNCIDEVDDTISRLPTKT